MSYVGNLTLHELRYNGTKPANSALTETIMEQMTAGQLEACTGGVLVRGSCATVLSGISIDSRTLRPGELFFAIRGAQQDGHRYVDAALDGGAAGAVVDAGFPIPLSFPAGRILLRVDDTHRALKDLARHLRAQWKGSLVAVTGSMGKTTTKEFIGQVLQTEFSVYRSPGNFNNLFGLPLAIAGLSCEDHIGIFEMGMSAPGEIAEMCAIARPDAGVITNVAPVHLEFFPSVEAIARAKGELADGLRARGVLVYNIDDPWVRRIAADYRGPAIGFGTAEDAEIRAGDIEVIGTEESRFRLTCAGVTYPAVIPLAGHHYVMNALPAVALARHYRIGMDQVLEGLRTLEQAPMRGQVHRFRQGFTVIDDSYNSNPRALDLMIGNLAAARPPRRRILVAGEMLELGSEAPRMHYECGARAARAGIDLLVGVRGLAREFIRGAIEAGMAESCAIFFTEVEPAIDYISGELKAGDLLMVKGSRGVRLERMVQALRAYYSQQAY